MVNEFTDPIWLGVSMLYMGTAVYLHVRHRGMVPWRFSTAFFSVGAAIFIALNRRIYGPLDAPWAIIGELTVLFALVVGWLLAASAVLHEIRANERWVDERRSGGPPR